MLRYVIGALLISATAFSNAGQPATARLYNFSPVNQQSLQVSAGFWNPILAYVSAKSGVELNLRLGRTSADTTAHVLAQEVDFAFTNHLFSPERAKLGWRVFGRRDAPPIRAQIVTAADGPVKTLAELANQEVAFPGPEAFIAYKVPYAHLINAGVAVKVVFGGNMDGAFGQLFSGTVKAVGANSQLVEGFAQREKKLFHVLWSSGPFYDLALMASPRVPDADLQAVAKAFFDMHRDPEGRAILETARELIGAPAPVVFVPAVEADYQGYRQFYRTAPPQLR
jgi:ABC-type phosphate/phosphonate transport system substrate-binding protein